VIAARRGVEVANTDILIRSYHRDFRWLSYCLRSIALFCSGFRQIVLVVPQSSAGRLKQLDLRGVVVAICGNYEVDYLGQQATKIKADLFSDADYICHVDSDWVFTRPCRPSDLHAGGRLTVGMTPYAALPPDIPWKQATERLLGHEVTHDFMRRQPYTFPRWLYPELRDDAERRHGQDIESYILRQPPLGFSEFNALGSFAYARHRAAFAWLDAGDASLPPPICKCYWSWGGLSEPIREDLERILHPADRAWPC